MIGKYISVCKIRLISINLDFSSAVINGVLQMQSTALLVLGSYAAGGQLYGKHNNNHKCKQFFHNKLLFQIDKMLFIGYTGIIAIIRLIVHFFLSMIFALSAIGEL